MGINKIMEGRGETKKSILPNNTEVGCRCRYLSVILELRILENT